MRSSSSRWSQRFPRASSGARGFVAADGSFMVVIFLFVRFVVITTHYITVAR